MTPQTRGTEPEPDVQRIKAALKLVEETQHQLEIAVADALKAGGSIRELAASTGVSTTTAQNTGTATAGPRTINAPAKKLTGPRVMSGRPAARQHPHSSATSA